MSDILMLTHYIRLSNESGNERITYIIEKILEKDPTSKIELVTSDFSHHYKKERKHIYSGLNYKLTMLKEPCYKKNISLKRVFAHWKYGKELGGYLKNRKKPDVIYCTLPTISAGYRAAKYANKEKVKFVIDIRDLWPEVFHLIVKNKLMYKIIFSTMEKKVNYIYKKADSIIAVSNTYLQRALTVNTKTKNNACVFLGTDLEVFDSFISNSPKYYELFTIVYIGKLSHSYDIELVIDALSILKKNYDIIINFLVMGDGPQEVEFENYAKKNHVKCEFTGRLPYKEMVQRLVYCDIAVNPIKTNSAQSIINKVGDYAAASLPVLNTQECDEYRKLINQFKCGLNCIPGDAKDLAEKIYILYCDLEMCKSMGKNNRKLAEQRFNRTKTYSEIVDIILSKQRSFF